MRLAWVTDLHLDWLDGDSRRAFYDEIALAEPDALLLGGDIGDSRTVQAFLGEIAHRLARPIYFVLGNHDFYYGSIAAMREAIARQCASSRWLRYLTVTGPIALSANCALIGHDGWADGRLGDFFGSPVTLNDYLLIEELTGLGKRRLYDQLNALGDEAAARLEEGVRSCLAAHRRVLVLTHVPPFREACWHEGNLSNDLYLPHFASRAAGERLAAVMSTHPETSMTILCGHTHSSGFAQPLPNLEVHTAGAEYGRPTVARVFDV